MSYSRILVSALLLILATMPVGTGLRARAAEETRPLGRFEIREPLGTNWTDEWVTRGVTLDTRGKAVNAGDLRVVVDKPSAENEENEELAPLLAQFYDPVADRLLSKERLSGIVKLRVLVRVTLPKNETTRFAVVAADGPDRRDGTVFVQSAGKKTTVGNGRFTLQFDADKPLPINAMACGLGTKSLGEFAWPEGVEPTGVADQWLERGPARAILKRTFRFKQPEHKYVVQFDVRADDSWIDVTEEHDLGKGTAVRLDLSQLGANYVYHPHTYNARDFGSQGETEDSTLEPPQHPIATLAPIWRDIWFGGGPAAFVYNDRAECGVGLATVRGNEWSTPEGISKRSQSLRVHGDREREGRVRVEFPTDGGRRRWALVLGPPDIRESMFRLIRARADVPLQKVLDEWVLEWKSNAQQHAYSFAFQWFGTFNRHILNPTTFPRRVRSDLKRMVESGQKVRSRELAMLAYIFMDPNYWPGPEEGWGNVGNPNFHTDMYNVPLQIALVMPDHPHAKRWLNYGVQELKSNVNRDSYPGGAWAESLSYSAFFFHICDLAEKLKQAGVARPFRDWPRLKEVATYLACMHTPVDPRYGSRQKAPIGDTSPGNFVDRLHEVAKSYRGVDNRFADQLARFPEAWSAALSLDSREFYGFGAMLRGNPYDRRHESFVTVKAGPARNHYQGDELSFHFCGLGTPLAIDYACHYSPRPWSASMHNRPDINGKRPVTLAERLAFATSDVADVFVAEESTHLIREVPMEPHHTIKPGREYPSVTLPTDDPWKMRRYTMLVKHAPKRSKLADYLVVRDEISSPEPVWWNLHVLARDIRPAGQTFAFPGQLDVDLTAHFLTPEVNDVEERIWGWGEHENKNIRRTLKGKEYEDAFFNRILPKDFKPGTWGRGVRESGEVGQWLRVAGDKGQSAWLVVLAPHARDREAPKVEKLSETSAKISLGNEVEIVHLGTEGEYQAAVERDGKMTVLIPSGKIKP